MREMEREKGGRERVKVKGYWQFGNTTNVGVAS
jgi:hypothetical protein